MTASELKTHIDQQVAAQVQAQLPVALDELAATIAIKNLSTEVKRLADIAHGGR